MYNVNFGQETEETVEQDRPIQVEPMDDRERAEEELVEDRTREETTAPVDTVVEEEVILVPAPTGMSTGQKVALGIGLGGAGLVVVGGVITAAVMKYRGD
jgi:hypothetical protein